MDMYSDLSNQSTDDMVGFFSWMPDPDPVLRKLGADERVFRSILSDPDVVSCIEDRKSSTLLRSASWVASDDSAQAERDLGAMTENLTASRMHDIVSAMLDFPYYGTIPVEPMWERNKGAAQIMDLRVLPSRYVRFNRSRQPKLLHGGEYITPPEGKLILVQNNPTWENPYGTRLLSRLLWPVAFRRGGLKYWYEFLDMFGIPHKTATLPKDQYREKRHEVAADLMRQTRKAISVIEEGTQLDTLNVRLAGHSSLHEDFYQAMGGVISRLITGASLARDHGRIGSFAAAKTHGETGARRSDMDGKKIEHTFEDIRMLYKKINPGSMPPKYMYERKTDLHTERSERDERLGRLGVRFSSQYVERAYNLEEGDVVGVGPGGASFASAQAIDREGEILSGEMVRSDRVGPRVAREIQDIVTSAKNFDDAEKRILALAGDDDEYAATLMHQALVAAHMYGRATLYEDGL